LIPRQLAASNSCLCATGRTYARHAGLTSASRREAQTRLARHDQRWSPLTSKAPDHSEALQVRPPITAILTQQPHLSVPTSRQRDKPHLLRSERPINRFLRFCKATTKSHDPKNAVTFGARERAHLAPSSKRRNGHKCPCDIAVAAFSRHPRALLLWSQGRNTTASRLRAGILGTVVFRGSCVRIKAGRDANLTGALSRVHRADAALRIRRRCCT
jgi:hypothetical protein